MGESPLEKRIKAYAFANGVDFDEASFRVLNDLVKLAQSKRSYEGLYDRMFKEETKNESEDK